MFCLVIEAVAEFNYRFALNENFPQILQALLTSLFCIPTGCCGWITSYHVLVRIIKNKKFKKCIDRSEHL